MSTIAIISDNPTTWNKPGWYNNSCYANSSLWAILYNNNYYPTIENIDKTVVTPDQNIIINGLTNFHNNIINNNNEITYNDFYNNSTLIIRQKIAELTKDKVPKDENGDYWLTQPASPYHFLEEIQAILQPSLNGGVLFQFQPLGVDETLENSSNNIIQITYTKTNTSNDIKVGENLIIEYAIIPGYPIDKYFRIGQYELYAFLYYPGGIHYSCFFSLLNSSNELIWYKFDDYTNSHQGSIELVGDISKIDNTLFFFQTTLFFYKKNISKKFSNELCSKLMGYDINTNQKSSQQALLKAQNALTPESNPNLIKNTSSSAAKSSSSSSNLTPAAPGATFISSIQVANNCEKYGQDWLDLFIDENALPGTLTVKRHQNKNNNKNNNNNIKLASFTNEKTGELTTINVPQNCTFTPEKTATPVVVAPAPLSRTESTDSTVTLTDDDVYSESEINGNIKDLDLKKVYNTVDANNTLNEKSIPIFIVFDNGSINSEYLHSNVNVNTSKDSDTDKTDLFLATGIFLSKDNATNFLEKQKLGQSTATTDASILTDKELTNIGPNTKQIINEYVIKFNTNKTDVYDINQIDVLKNKNVKEFLEKNTDKKCFKSDDNNYYIPITDIKDSIKWYNIYNNKICNLDLNACKIQTKNQFNGGTRRNRNIKFETRKGKGKGKGKRKTRKLIRHKNKLRTNKLRTNKLRTNKLRTNKLRTRKLKLNKRKTRKS
jgi:hypothetical protein